MISSSPILYGLILTAVALLITANSSVLAQQHALVLTVSDGVNQKDLTVGLHPDGQSYFVQGLDLLAPPSPPSSAFDARIIVQNESYFTKFLDTESGEKRFQIRYRKETGNQPIQINWSELQLFENATFSIEDRFGGQLYSNLLTDLEESFQPSELHDALSDGFVFVIVYEATTSLEQTEDRLVPFRLSQNYPNPFNPSTTITFDLLFNSHVKISVLTSNGRLIQTLFNGFKREGQHVFVFDGSHLASGLYLLAIDVDHYLEVIKMNLIK